MKGRRSEKLTKCFVGSYKVKGIVSSNAIELELPNSIKIHPVVNVSRVQLYKPQVRGRRRYHQNQLSSREKRNLRWRKS